MFEDDFDSSDARLVLTVSQLNAEVRRALEQGFPLLWVEGEISNFAMPSSGHMYFSLKDAAAQVRCAMFKQRNLHLRFKPANGTQVLVRARIGLYEARGEYQLIVEHMEPAGDGLLKRAIEALKRKLDAEGLFAETAKKPLPPVPGVIGVITSPTGAAVRDIISVLRRRFPAAEVVIYPVAVQGDSAPDEIAAAFETANRRNECDVLILARGGGSLEDLMAFNDEGVARAVHASAIPVVAGVGHEIDVTIADLVADVRAPTPTGAAELTVPDAGAWSRQFRQYQDRLQQAWRNRRRATRNEVSWLVKRLKQAHPGQRLRDQAQRLDGLEQRLGRALGAAMAAARSDLAAGEASLMQLNPAGNIRQLGLRLAAVNHNLEGAMQRRLESCRHQTAELGRALNAVSPLATLGRGYAIVTAQPEDELVTSTRQLEKGREVRTRLQDGEFEAVVSKIRNRK